MPKSCFTHKKQTKDSKYIGVYKNKTNDWICKLKNKTFGPFKDEIECARFYDQKAKQLFGDNVKWLNFEVPKHIQMKVRKIKVIKPKNRENERIKFPIFIRNKVSEKQGWKCNFCKNLLPAIFIIDHIIPLCLGGTNDSYNLQSLCDDCNQYKTSIIDRKYLKPLSEQKVLTQRDVLELQIEHYHQRTCSNPNEQSDGKNNYGTINYINNSTITNTTDVSVMRQIFDFFIGK